VTATAYNLESRWAIPPYVWPGVLGVSVAMHLGVLVYGLPVLPWKADDLEFLPETEVILEAGGPIFEEADLVEPQPLDLAQTSSTEFVEQTAPEVLPIPQAETSEFQPETSASVQTELTPLEHLTSNAVPILPETVPDQAEIVQAQEVTTLSAVDVTPVPAEPVDVLPVETVDAAQTDSVFLPQITVSTPAPTDLVQPESGLVEEVADAASAVSITSPQEVAIVPLVSMEVDDATVSQAVPVDTVTLLEPEIALVGEDTSTLEPVQVEQLVSDLGEGAQAVTEVVSLAPSIPGQQTEPLQSEAPVDLSNDVASQIVEQDNAVALTPLAVQEVDTITPNEQQLVVVEQVETVVAALSPTEPETAAVPLVEDPSTPADLIPPVEVATIDPLANITTYVKNYKIGDCAHLSVLSAGTDSAEVTAFGAGSGAFAAFDQRFAAEQGFEASIQLRLVTEQQCGLLNALGVSQGVEAAGLVELDKTVVTSGTQTTGLIQRDLPYARIAAAEQAGLDLGGKGPPELYLIDDAGRIHDARDFLLPASSASTAGAWRFKVPVVKMSPGEQETALVLAIWNRPGARQPPRFGTLPPSRIATILSEPGVYSLAAFKVSR